MDTCPKTGEPEDHQRQVAFCCQTLCIWRDPQVQGAVCGEGVYSNLRSGLKRDLLPNRATYISAMFMGNRSAAEVFGVSGGHQDGVLECTNRRGDLHAATGGVREFGRVRTTVGVPVAEIVVWAETVWEELAPDVDRVPPRAGIQSINQRRACVNKDSQQPVVLCEHMG